MCVSTNPPHTNRPAASYSAASACRCGSIATIRPAATPISTAGASGAWANRALRMIRSINGLLQMPIPHREDLPPGLFCRQRVVDRALWKAEAVMRAGEHMQLVPGARLVQSRLQLGDHVLRYRLVAFGEGAIQYTAGLGGDDRLAFDHRRTPPSVRTDSAAGRHPPG